MKSWDRGGGTTKERQMMPAETPIVTLRPIDQGNVRIIIDDLKVDPSQVDFVAPNAISLAEAFVATKVWVRAIYAGDEAVGFAMLSDDDEQPRYYLWRFMIDARHQGKGYGSAAMQLIHEYVRTRPGGDRIFLSYVPAEGGPQPFYASLGYVDTGRVHGGEVEAVLVFGSQPASA
jgi:diamine N-acetyltransferase